MGMSIEIVLFRLGWDFMNPNRIYIGSEAVWVTNSDYHGYGIYVKYYLHPNPSHVCLQNK